MCGKLVPSYFKDISGNKVRNESNRNIDIVHDKRNIGTRGITHAISIKCNYYVTNIKIAIKSKL